jgi:hypothetical protein
MFAATKRISIVPGQLALVDPCAWLASYGKDLVTLSPRPTVMTITREGAWPSVPQKSRRSHRRRRARHVVCHCRRCRAWRGSGRDSNS